MTKWPSADFAVKPPKLVGGEVPLKLGGPSPAVRVFCHSAAIAGLGIPFTR